MLIYIELNNHLLRFTYRFIQIAALLRRFALKTGPRMGALHSVNLFMASIRETSFPIDVRFFGSRYTSPQKTLKFDFLILRRSDGRT